MNKRVYLAGRVTGRYYKRVYAEFAAAKQFLLDQGFDEVVNPCEIIVPGTGWTESMIILLPYLATCNFLAILPGYQRSNDAMTEYYFGLGMEKEGHLQAIIHIDLKIKSARIKKIKEPLKAAI